MKFAAPSRPLTGRRRLWACAKSDGYSHDGERHGWVSSLAKVLTAQLKCPERIEN